MWDLYKSRLIKAGDIKHGNDVIYYTWFYLF